MTFAVPLFLAAGLAAVIPVIVHMINRQKAKDLTFPTLRFLRVSVQKTRNRRRIQDVSLMLLRCSVLLFLALGLAKPTVTNLHNLFGSGSGTAVAIVLDNSASMGQIDNDVPRMQTALHAAGEIMDQLQPGDQLALLVTNGPPFPESGKLDRGHEHALEILAHVKVSYERADVGGRLDEARNLLAKCDAPNKQLFVISDFQTISWENLKRKLADQAKAADKDKKLTTEEQAKRDMPIVVVDVNRAPRPNVAVCGVQIDARVPIAGVAVKAVADFFNASTIPQQRLAELYIDGNREVSSPVLNIPAGEHFKHEFEFRFKSGGMHRGEVRLVGEDGSKLDDTRFFTMEVDQGIPVAVVKPQPHEIAYLDDAHYLEVSLGYGKAGSWAIRPTTLTAAQLANEPLNNFKILFLVNLPAPDEAAADKLKAYVERGGNLFWSCGENVNPEAYNQMNQHAGGELLPAPLLEIRAPQPGENRDSYRVASLDKEYPPLKQFIEPPSLYQSVLVYRHVRMDVGKGANTAAQVLARLDDGEPLMALRRVGKGTVTMLGTTAHVDWSNFPLRPLFTPLILQLTYTLSGTEQARFEGLAGMPIVLPFGDDIRPAAVEIVPPSGETIRKTLDEGNSQLAEFRYNDTYDIGIYMLRMLQGVSAKQIAYSVNVDPDESSAKKMSHEELEEMFAPEPLVFAANPNDLQDTFRELKQGRSLWGTFLTLVLVVLVCESFISNWLTPKKDEDEALQNLPPGMRRLAKKGKIEAA